MHLTVVSSIVRCAILSVTGDFGKLHGSERKHHSTGFEFGSQSMLQYLCVAVRACVRFVPGLTNRMCAALG